MAVEREALQEALKDAGIVDPDVAHHPAVQASLKDATDPVVLAAAVAKDYPKWRLDAVADASFYDGIRAQVAGQAQQSTTPELARRGEQATHNALAERMGIDLNRER